MPDCLYPPRGAAAAEPPPPDAAALALSEHLTEFVHKTIKVAGGHIPFDRFMELALYAPGMGYYVAGSRKFGEAGDFVTAPEVSPLFGRCIARQVREVFSSMGGGDVLEYGAGSGTLAVEVLTELERLDALPENYFILEISPELKERQHETLAKRAPDLLPRVSWLELQPSTFCGVVLANELLDAMPVNRFRIGTGGIEECYVEEEGDELKEVFGFPETPGLADAVNQISEHCGELTEGYASEVNLRQASWIRALAGMLERGAALLIDYGYPRSEYYHPQRNTGTLMCHYRHRAHPDPFRWLGLQDITSHVDFSAAAKVAVDAGLTLAGYTTQAHFLMANGLDEIVAASDPNDLAKHMELVQGVKRLTLPSEMGERFKVLGLTKNLPLELSGFSLLNLQDRL